MNKAEETKKEKKQYSKFWLACQKFKGAFVVYDPNLAL